MKALSFLLLGYLIHDAVQPTLIGKTLDKIALPSDLLTQEGDANA